MRHNKNGLSGVVATSLLLIVAVASIISFQSWFSMYTSSLYTENEETGSGLSTRVERVIGNTIYFNNQHSNVTITNVQVDGISCNVTSSSYGEGIQSFNGNDCLNGTSTGVKEVVFVTDKGVYSFEFYYDSSLSSGTTDSGGSEETGPISTDTFISTWNTSIAGVSASNQIQLPLRASGTYNFNVTGNNLVGSPITITSDTDNVLNFSTSGVQTIEITGTIDGWSFMNTGDKSKLLEISQWGPLKLGNDKYYFMGSSNLQITATDLLNTSGMNDMDSMFNGATSLSEIPNVEYWDVDNVTNMYRTFMNTNISDLNLSTWNVSKVTTMNQMFSSADNFNGDISSWDVSQVTDFYRMFFYTNEFNNSIGSWTLNDGSSINMHSMFENADGFNQPLNSWDVSRVTSMRNLFAYADNFNQPLNNWNVSSVTAMGEIFSNSISFNQNISGWDVDQVISCTNYDYQATSWQADYKPALAGC